MLFVQVNWFNGLFYIIENKTDSFFRECSLSDFFILLCNSESCQQMYDEHSFLRNTALNKFTHRLLSILNQFPMKLEAPYDSLISF
jgi:hypothetical protein